MSSTSRTCKLGAVIRREAGRERGSEGGPAHLGDVLLGALEGLLLGELLLHLGGIVGDALYLLGEVAGDVEGLLDLVILGDRGLLVGVELAALGHDIPVLLELALEERRGLQVI